MVAVLLVLRVFLETGKFLSEGFGTGLQILHAPALVMTPERLTEADTPVGQGHQSQLPFQVEGDKHKN